LPPDPTPLLLRIDFPDRSQLIAHDRTVEEVRQFLGVDSLHYLSLEGMLSCLGQPSDHYCTACWSGRYPINVDKPVTKLDLERFQLRMFSSDK